jgi:hypothetical protein
MLVRLGASSQARSLSGSGKPQNRSNPMAVADLPWRASSSVEPLRKIPEPNLVLDANVGYGHFDDIETLGNPSDPFVAPDRRKALGDGLI